MMILGMILALTVVGLVCGLIGWLLAIREGYDMGHDAGWKAAGGPELPPLEEGVSPAEVREHPIAAFARRTQQAD
jgi:hypothetical protein